jgi:hypothetical protein
MAFEDVNQRSRRTASQNSTKRRYSLGDENGSLIAVALES